MPPIRERPANETQASFEANLFLDNAFGAFWAHAPRVVLEASGVGREANVLDTGTGLASKRALGVVADNSKEALSIAIFYSSGNVEIAKNRYRLDGVGLELGYERSIKGKFGVATGLGLGAVRTKLKIDGLAFADQWAPGASLSIAGTYALSDWRSIAVRHRTDLLPSTSHDWPGRPDLYRSAEVGARMHTQLEIVLRRRF